MSNTDIPVFIPQKWEPKTELKLHKYAQKSELNNFILKNTDINMNNHVIENVKNKGSNDAVNKLYVDNQISAVQSKIPYMTFIKETVTGSETTVKTIQKSIEDPVFNGLKPENVLLIPRFEYNTNEGPLNLNAKVVSINNNTLTFNIKIENRHKQGWELSVVVYVYIIIVYQHHIVSDIQNDEPAEETSSLSNVKSNKMATSYF